MPTTRNKIVAQAQSWLGCKESDGSHKQIIDVYNAHKPLPRGYAVKCIANGDSKNDAWCATFVTACAIKCGATDIIPKECSCNKMIELFKNLGCWKEGDAYVPSPADIIFYDWEDTGSGDNVGVSDHVGIVEKVSGDTITVIEGNYSNACKRRTLKINGRYIRGYGVPKYVAETSTTFAKGDKVKVKAAVTYEGKPFKVYYDTYDVIDAKGDRIVIGIGKTVTAAVKASSLTKSADKEVKGGSKVRVREGAKTFTGGNLASFVYKRDHIVKEINGDRVVITYNGSVVAAVRKSDLIVI